MPRRMRSLDQTATGEPQEDVLERGTPDELARWPQTGPVDRLGRGLAIVGVHQCSIGQLLDALDEATEVAFDLRRRWSVEAKFKDFATAVLLDE